MPNLQIAEFPLQNGNYLSYAQPSQEAFGPASERIVTAMEPLICSNEKTQDCVPASLRPPQTISLLLVVVSLSHPEARV